jgi:uncharacterized protein YndB with AHSA1/START domain
MATQTEYVECQVHIAASPETVFSFFTDSTKMLKWQGIAARLDPQPEGEFFCDLDDGIVMSGKFLELDPFKRLLFSFGWQGHHVVSPGSTRVEVLVAEEGGGTLLTLRHHGLPADEHDMHSQGWMFYLERLVIVAGGGDAGPHRKPGQ